MVMPVRRAMGVRDDRAVEVPLASPVVIVVPAATQHRMGQQRNDRGDSDNGAHRSASFDFAALIAAAIVVGPACSVKRRFLHTVYYCPFNA